ncbi:hypothetical protein DRJ48_01845 [Candidatus Woesearchaeota archaeon]|nr:metallophosphoesterase family protein [Candidatus Woesearchaeota archaeon]RLE43098.1 MAG: hypothetical protein DRJ48_01845 [Candidatus Woesearchaeota archaeon]
MKILAFVDLHGNIALLKRIVVESKNYELVVCAGDISNFEHNLSTLLAMLAKATPPVLIIPGNHETPEALQEACSKHPKLLFLHRGLYKAKGISFVGYGTGGFSIVDKGFEGFAERVKPHLSGKVVLITHAPPHKTKLDIVLGEHRGSKSIRKFITSVKPVLAICGHFHETEGQEDYIGRTRIVNPGKRGKLLVIQ